VDTDAYTANMAGEFPVKWASPEVIEMRIFSQKSDVWSFGIVMWEIFEYGKVPYGVKNNEQTLVAVLEGYRLPCPSNCTHSMYSLMESCWNSDPKKRPTFKELIEKLAELRHRKTAPPPPEVRTNSTEVYYNSFDNQTLNNRATITDSSTVYST